MQTEEKALRTINHKAMRAIIGAIAVLMPTFVVLLSGYDNLSSISISYWTDSRDIFVGSLIAVAFFLSAYNGTGTCGKDMEYWLSKAAFIFAMGIALFPTTDFNGCEDCAPQWIMYVSDLIGLKPHEIHYTAAILLFVCLFLLISFFSTRAKKKGKLFRSRFYRAISLGMLLGMPIVYYVGELSDKYEKIFAVEVLGLGLFGVGWLVAGWYKTESQNIPDGAIQLKEIEVDPRNRNFPTGIEVEANARYFFLAKGCWKDWFIGCGPNGWGSRWNPLAYNNRIMWQPFFLLCGNIGKDDSLAFSIGDKHTWRVPPAINELDDRQLYLFANDWKNKYTNNKPLESDQGGPLKVTIYRLKEEGE